MGEVWRGRHRRQDVPVAVKVMTREQARNPDFVSALRQEVRAAASLNHDGVVMVLDYGEIEGDLPFPQGSPYVAMELCSGGTLADLQLPLPWGEVRYLLSKLLDALAHAHARGVIHRDIKPANVLIATGEDLRPGLKLTDFGIAHLAEERDREGSAEDGRGTPLYAAPEQLLGHWRDYGPWTDLYAVGCLAWQLLTRRPPFLGRSYRELVLAHSAAELPDFRPVHPVPDGVERWLRRALSKAPLARFRRAAEAAWMLEQLGGEVRTAPSFLRKSQPVPALSPYTVLLPGTTQQLDSTGTRIDPMPAGDLSTGRIVLDRGRPTFPDDWRTASPPAQPLRLIGAGLELHGLRQVPFVGREETRDRLWSVFQKVHASGMASAVVLRGPAGVGKTRLATWLQERAHELGLAATMRATHSAQGALVDGLGPMIARHAGLRGLSGEELDERCLRLARTFGLDDAGVGRWLANIASPGQRDASGDGEWSSHLTAMAIYITWIGVARPMVVVMDDVQWGPQAIELARHIVSRRDEAHSGDCRALLVLIAQDEALADRPDEAEALASLERQRGVSTIQVGELPLEDQRELCFRGLQLTPDLATRVARRAGGSPYFAIQLVDDWVQRGLLTSGEDGFGLVTDRAGDEPATVQQLWGRQVDRVVERAGPDTRPALEIAAVLGQNVHLGEWRDVCARAGVELSPSLLHMMFATRLAVPTDDGLRFSHVMLRDSLRAASLERARYERAAVAMLLARYPFPSDELLDRIQRHEAAAEAAP